MSEAGDTAIDLKELYGELWDRGVMGGGVTIAVPDTEIDSATLALQATISPQGAPNFPLGVIETIALAGPPSATPPLKSHGGAVISRIMQVAPAAKIIHFPIFNPQAEQQTLLGALALSAENSADVVNLSLGIPVRIDEIEAHYRNCPVCHRAETMVAEHDSLVFAAVGNWAEQALGCPGLAPNVTAVGSVLTAKESAYYKQHPGQQLAHFLEGRSSTSYATAIASASCCLYRSAFPAIDSSTWLKMQRIASGHITPGTPNYDEPIEVFKYFREIFSADYINAPDWRKLHDNGIRNRRELVAAVDKPHPPALSEIFGWATVHRARAKAFADAVDHYILALDDDDQKSDAAVRIDEAGIAADMFTRLSLSRMAAAAWVLRASALCQRARIVTNGQTSINLKAVTDAYQNTRSALGVLAQPQTDTETAIKATALSWGARALTFLAEVDHAANESAIEEATRAAGMLAALKPTRAITKDLAHAYLHLARAFFFRKKVYTKDSTGDSARVVANASKALRLGGAGDDYTRSESEWLIVNAG